MKIESNNSKKKQSEMKNAFKGINSGTEEAENQTSSLDDKEAENLQSGEQQE